MSTTTAVSELTLRSFDDVWNRERWETLSHDTARYEVIDGVLYMTTAPSSMHQWIIRQTVRVLFAQIDDQAIGVTLWSPIGLFMPNCDPVQPDILVLRTADMDCIQERGIHGIPALIIEVLSPNNPTYDTVIKHRAYAGAGVPEYWIIRPAMQNVLVCSQPDTQLRDYAHTFVVGIEETLISPTLPIQTPVANLFIGLPDSTPGGA